MRRVRRSIIGIAAMTAAAIAAPHGAPAGALVAGRNGRFVFSSDRGGQQELYTMRPDGGDVQQLTHSAPGLQTTHPAWSPDGEWVAFNRDSAAGVDIWIIDRAGHHERQVTHLDNVSDEPAWSPDGRRIVFQHVDPTTGYQDLFTVRPDGSHVVRITNTPTADEVLASFSPDGKWLADGIVTHAGTDSFAHVRVSRSDGSNPRDITPDALDGGRPGWSPDGSHIVFSSNFVTGVAQSLYSIDPNGVDVHRLTSVRAGAGDSFAAYSPDGRKITFTSDRRGADADIFVMRADGSDVRDITPAPAGSFDTDGDWRSR